MRGLQTTDHFVDEDVPMAALGEFLEERVTPIAETHDIRLVSR